MCKHCNYIKEKHFSDPKIGDLRVWWIPQLPMKAFYYPVTSIREAKLLLNILAQYDLFQMEHNVKGDYSNVGGLHIYEYDPDIENQMSWGDWYNEDGESINEVDDSGNTLEEDE